MSTFIKSLIATTLLVPAWVPSTASAQDSCEDSIIIDDQTDDDEAPRRGPVTAEQSAGFANDCFVGGRAAAILSLQPDLQSRRAGQDQGIYASQAGGVADTGGYAGPLWTSLGARQSELDGAELEQGMATIGGDLFFTDTTVFGVMLQSDISNQTGPTTDVKYDATGLMGGIYAIYVDGNLAVDGRIMGGRSTTDISEAGDAVDDIDSTRWLAAAQVSTQTELGGGQLLVPHISVGWFEDTMDGYTLNAINIPETTIRYGQADLGGTWLLPITMGDADGNVILGASGIKGFGDAAGEEVPDDLRGRFDFGLELFRGNEWAVSGIVFTDGLGQDNFEAYGADLGVTIWF